MYILKFRGGKTARIGGSKTGEMDDVELVEELSEEAQKAMVGIRSRSGTAVHEIVYVLNGYGLVAESVWKESLSRYEVTKQFLVPLSEVAHLDVSLTATEI